MRRHTSVWAAAVSPENRNPVAQRIDSLESSRDSLDKRARERTNRRGQGTRHAGRGRPRNLGGPSPSLVGTGRRGSRRRSPEGATASCACGGPSRRSTRARVGRSEGNQSVGRWRAGVGGLRKSGEGGERQAPGPGGAKAARVERNFRRETWPAGRRRRPCPQNY